MHSSMQAFSTRWRRAIARTVVVYTLTPPAVQHGDTGPHLRGALGGNPLLRGSTGAVLRLHEGMAYTDSELLAMVEERLLPIAATLSADDLAFVKQMLARPLVTSAPLAPATRERIQRLLWCSAPPGADA